MADDINFEVTGFGELRKQLREAQLEMIKLAEAGKAGTAEFAKQAKKVGELKEAIGDAADAATVFQDGGKFKAAAQGLGLISSAFGAVQGAAAIAGGDVKEFQATMVKLQSAIAITSFFESFAEIGDIFKKLKLAAIDTFTTIKAQIGSTGIGLLVVGLGAAVYALSQMEKQVVKLTNAQKALNGVEEETSKILKQEYSTSLALIDVVNDQNQSIKARQAALEKLQESYPGYLKNLNIETASTKELKAQTDALAESIYKRAKAEAALEKLKTIAAQELEAELTKNNRLIAQQEQIQKLYGSPEGYGAVQKQQKQFEVLNKNADKFLEDLKQQRENVLAFIKESGGLEDALTGSGKTTDKKADDAAKKRKDRLNKALDDLKELNLAINEQQKQSALQLASTEEEKATIENDYFVKSIDIQKNYEKEKEKLRDEDEKSETALTAKLTNLDNQKTASATKLNDTLLDLAQKRKEREAKAVEDFKNASREEYENTKKYIDDAFNARETAIRKEGLKEEELKAKLDQLELEKLEAKKTAAKDYVATVEQAGSDVVEIELEISKKITDIDKKTQEEKIKNFQEYADTVIQGAQAVTDAFAAQLDFQQQKEIEAIKASSKNEEEKAKAIDDVKKKYFEKNKSIEIANAIISTISGALNAFVSTLKIDPTGITGSILAAAALATGYFQVEKIKATTYESSISGGGSKEQSPQGSMYAEGGLLMGRSHNLGGIKTSMGQLEGGEFVMNRRATANFLPLLQAINAQGNTAGPEIPQYQQNIIKTYVVASDMTSQQEAAAKLNALARL